MSLIKPIINRLKDYNIKKITPEIFLKLSPHLLLNDFNIKQIGNLNVNHLFEFRIKNRKYLKCGWHVFIRCTLLCILG